jgi:molybdenum cofactor cytidylyltransferase
MKCAGLIAAAGESSRMGEHKALLQIGNLTFTQRLVQTFVTAKLSPIILTLPDSLLRASAGGIFITISNAFPKRELLGSIQSAIQQLDDDIDALLVCPIDAPLIEAELIMAMLEQIRSHNMVVPTFNGRRGHPVIFTRFFFDALLACHSSASALMADNSENVCELAWHDDSVLHNLNRPDDLANVTKN